MDIGELVERARDALWKQKTKGMPILDDEFPFEEVLVRPSKNPDSWVYPLAEMVPGFIGRKIRERHGGDYTPEEIRNFYREDFIESCQDLVNDKAKNHPEYKELLGKAKFFDKLWPLNVIPCNVVNQIIERDEAEAN